MFSWSEDSCGITPGPSLFDFPFSTMLLLLVLAVVLGGVCGQVCDVRQLALCNDLCDSNLEDPIVEEVLFSGVIASLNCLPNHIHVSPRINK